jgi:predicted glycoside hydrolase/deacetylase ChbG (UPF0249 family)
MMIVVADDWGRSRAETDAALACHRAGRLGAASAMVFMPDSARAAGLALEHGLETGLHLNLSEPFAPGLAPGWLRVRQQRIAARLARHRWSRLLFDRSLEEDFAQVVGAQIEQYRWLYGREPGHVDGHRHLHLCENVLRRGLLPAGVRVRRNHSFGPGEKPWLNRAYRRWVDARVAARHPVTDRFHDLAACLQPGTLEGVFALAQAQQVELMTHPVRAAERECLLGERFGQLLAALRTTPVPRPATAHAPTLSRMNA